MDSLCELIKAAQGDRSQNEYALHSGVSSAAITRILSGDRKPSPSILRKLAEHAYNGISYNDFMRACGYMDEDDSPRPVVIDDEARELMEEMRTRDEMRVLFNVSKKATKKDIEAVNELLKRMVGREDD